MKIEAIFEKLTKHPMRAALLQLSIGGILMVLPYTFANLSIIASIIAMLLSLMGVMFVCTSPVWILTELRRKQRQNE